MVGRPCSSLWSFVVKGSPGCGKQPDDVTISDSLSGNYNHVKATWCARNLCAHWLQSSTCVGAAAVEAFFLTTKVFFAEKLYVTKLKRLLPIF